MKTLIVLFVYTTMAACSYRDHLNQFLHEFEELAKENVYLEQVINSTVFTAMKFYVRVGLQNKVLHASLQPHISLFHPDLVVKHKFSNMEKVGSLDVSEYLEGHIIDKSDSSRVLLHIRDNIITGTIQVNNEKYFIEPSHRHIKEPHDFHMIVYKQSDVKFNLTKPGTEGMGHFCGHKLHNNQSAFSDHDFKFMIPEKPINDEFEYSRKKRSLFKKTHCPLALVADYKFTLLNGLNQGNTIQYMLSIIQQVDDIFQKQSLDHEEADEYLGYGFVVKYIEVIMDQSEKDKTSYKYVAEDRKVNELLESFDKGSWTPDVCLAHLFTNYDFEGGVLGLAYIADPSQSTIGGVCSKKYSSDGYKVSSNTGLTTLTNYGRTLLSSEAVFVTGHEFGHNWGCSHDSDTSKDCAPKNNRYLMYPAAVDGSQPNNYKFSPCCKKAINNVLISKSDRCFTDVAKFQCGNGVVEEEEECDPGYGDSPCCEACKLTKGSDCEPANEECCGQKGSAYHCKLQVGKTCHLGLLNSCHVDRTCQKNETSDKVQCTAGLNVEDGESCFDNGRCKSGKCLDHCEFFNKYPCLCAEEKNHCKQCCKDMKDGECKLFINGEDEGRMVVNLPNGKFCGDGTCVDGVCLVGAQDVLEKLWEIFDDLNVNQVSKWFKLNIVFTIILLSTLIWAPVSIFLNFLDKKYYRRVIEENYRELDMFVAGGTGSIPKTLSAHSTSDITPAKDHDTKSKISIVDINIEDY